MARIIYSARALTNLEALFAFIAEHDAAAAARAAVTIREAISRVGRHPLIGRRVAGEIRELIISFGATGFVALYRHLPDQNLVRVLAVRHQRQIDYP